MKNKSDELNARVQTNDLLEKEICKIKESNFILKSNDIDIEAIHKMKFQLEKDKIKVNEDVKENQKLKEDIVKLQNELKDKIHQYDDKLNYLDVQEKKIKNERLAMVNRSSNRDINSCKSEYSKDPNLETSHLKQALNLKTELIHKLRDDMDTYYINYKKENDGLRSMNEDLKRKLINAQVETDMVRSTHNEQSLDYKFCGNLINMNMSVEDNRPDRHSPEKMRNTLISRPNINRSNHKVARNSVDLIYSGGNSPSPHKKFSMSLERPPKDKLAFNNISNLASFTNTIEERDHAKNFKSTYNSNAMMYDRNIGFSGHMAKSIEDSTRQHFDEDYISTMYLINKYQKKNT